MNKCVFTICARNYLAQALTLKDTLLKHNDIDFRIFIADALFESPDLEFLDDSWIPNWKDMAFMYNITEFNTSIKPYCFDKLFNSGYDKVIYLDPDIMVADSLDIIWNILDDKSIMLTPHFCEMKDDDNSDYKEKELLQDGICNLGFCAIANTDVGKKIIKWWKNRLHNQCFDAKAEGLFTDQKWMMFIPVFFPNDVYISHHMGLNVAVWNLTERRLVQYKNNYIVERVRDNKQFPLIFFHFSGFSPLKPTMLTRRKPDINVDTYPSLRFLIEEYSRMILRNGFEKLSALTYGFSSFSNGIVIKPLHRRLYRQWKEDHPNIEVDPFDVDDVFYKVLKNHHFIVKEKNLKAELLREHHGGSLALERKYIHPLLRIIKVLLGVEYYSIFIKLCAHIGRPEYNYFLIEEKK